MAEDRVVVVGDVADGVDVRVAGTQGGVDQHAVVQVETGRFGQGQVGGHADPGDDRVRRDRGAVAEPGAGGAAVAGGDGVDADVQPEVHTVGPVQVREHLRELGSEHAEQRQLGCFQQSHRGAGPAGGRGDLQPDPSAADDDQALAVTEAGADGVRVF